MLSFIIGLLLGAFIGWNLPQPQWAKNLQSKFMTYIKDNFK